MRYAKIYPFDVTNGEGCRVSVFVQGCDIHCEGCFNQQLWDLNGGKLWTKESMAELRENLKPEYIKGVTWLGGEPSLYANEIADINKHLKRIFPEKDIWFYTGREFSDIVRDCPRLLDTIDVIVTGPYIEDLRDPTLPFRGSKNQKIYHLKKDYYGKNVC